MEFLISEERTGSKRKLNKDWISEHRNYGGMPIRYRESNQTVLYEYRKEELPVQPSGGNQQDKPDDGRGVHTFCECVA